MRRAGFTLVEVMVAVLISGFAMVAVLANLDATRSAVDAIHNVMETESTGPRVLDTIRGDLARLAIYDAEKYRVLKGENANVLGADADRLDMLVAGRTRLGFDVPNVGESVHAPLAEVGYRLRANPLRNDFLELYRREDPLVDNDPWRDGAYALLYDRVVSFNLRYAAKPDYNVLWEEDWDSEQREALPFAIDVYFEIEVQPRRSLESLGILGANRSRLNFSDLLLIPSHERWTFRNRLHPVLPEPDAAAGGAPGAGGLPGGATTGGAGGLGGSAGGAGGERGGTGAKPGG